MLNYNFNEFPDSSRVWVYGTDRALSPAEAHGLLAAVDSYLTTWEAHGTPLEATRDWSHDRFLTIAVDQQRAGASGCSIDGLFGALKTLQKQLGAMIVTSGLIFFRDRTGTIRSVTRDQFTELGAAGDVDGDTEVFDPSVVTLGEWRSRFSSRASDSWHSSLLAVRAR